MYSLPHILVKTDGGLTVSSNMDVGPSDQPPKPKQAPRKKGKRK